MSNHWTDKPNPEFERWWATKTAAGYQYGREALENVRFGFEGAQERRWLPIETAPKNDATIFVYCTNKKTYQVFRYLDEDKYRIYASGGRYLWETPIFWMPLPDPPSFDQGEVS